MMVLEITMAYNCMGNISSINISNPLSNTEYGYNYRTKLLLQNKYLTSKIVYQVDAKNLPNHEKKFYLRDTESPCKECFGNHMQDFKHPKCRKK